MGLCCSTSKPGEETVVQNKPTQAPVAAATTGATKQAEAKPVATPAVTTATPNPVADGESLVPPHHIDEHGHKVADEGGGRVWSEAYYRARKDADDHAKLRGECFDKSKTAFNEDRKGDAKTLSDEGKKHGVEMEAANQRAVAEIMGYQNLEENTLDLHGLLVKEAVDCTRTFVNKHKASGKFKQLCIIPGAGNHSDPKKGAVIKPAIIDLAKEEKWNLEADEGNDGSFTLTF